MRTLRQKLQDLDFNSGVNEYIFDLIKSKIANCSDEAVKDCGIFIDGMSITPGRFYEPQTQQNIGYVTLPAGSDTIASHGFIIVLAGLHF